jgi:hypothetical protein
LLDQFNRMGKAFTELSSEQQKHSQQIGTLQNTATTLLNIRPSTSGTNPTPAPPPLPATPKPKTTHKRDASKDIHPDPPKKTKGKDKAPGEPSGSSYANVAATAPPAPDSSPEKPKNLPVAQRRFFATRSSPTPIPEHEQWTAKLPVIAASYLKSIGCNLPLALTAAINQNGTISLTANPTTPATAFQPYFSPLAKHLSTLLKLDPHPLTDFKPAPNNSEVAIHGIPLFALPTEPKDLDEAMKSAVHFATNVTIASARYLQPDPQVRAQKTATSVVISISKEEALIIGSTIRLFSRVRKVAPIHSTNTTAHCRNCYRLGHPHQTCPDKTPTCPICSGSHTRAQHRCENLGCPKGGHLRPTPSCCPSSPPKCRNCSGAHTVFDLTCPIKNKAQEDLNARLASRRSPTPPTESPQASTDTTMSS